VKNLFDEIMQNRHPARAASSSPLRPSSGGKVMLACISLLLAALLASTGCSTKIKREWKDDAFQPGRIRNILVIAAARSDTVRRFGESELVKQLRKRGVSAVESFTVLPDAGIDDARFREAIVAKIKEGGIDAILIARSLGSRTDVESSQATVIYTAPYASYNTWYSYYAFAPDWGYPSSTPSSMTGISYERNYITMESSLYDAKSEKLVWQLQSETQAGGLPEEEIKPYAELVIRKLLGSRLF
jgi:hypothetical protein